MSWIPLVRVMEAMVLAAAEAICTRFREGQNYCADKLKRKLYLVQTGEVDKIAN